MKKSEAHTAPGFLHCAFSICIFRNNRTEILIQKRHPDKLFGGLWANSCCSHLCEDEEIIPAAQKRLMEELGFMSELHVVGSFCYCAEDLVHHGMENEHDTVLVGYVDEVTVIPNAEEVAEWKWIPLHNLGKDMREHSENYAPWFSLVLKMAPNQHSIFADD